MFQHLLWGEQQVKAQLAMEAVKVGVGDMAAEVRVDGADVVEMLTTHIAWVRVFPSVNALVLRQDGGMSKPFATQFTRVGLLWCECACAWLMCWTR